MTPKLELMKIVALRMYEAAHPQSAQWWDASPAVQKKWLRLARIAMATIAEESEK